MHKRVGLERSICTGNARRVSLFDALMSAFPREQGIIRELLGADKGNESSRKALMPYLEDLALTGIHGNDLKLFCPLLEQTILLERDLPKWTRMLRDGRDTCCFAVAVDACLVYSEEPHLSCRNSERRYRRMPFSHPQTNLFSTTINLHGNFPTVRLPLIPGGILKLNSGRLTITSYRGVGFTQLATFWLPGTMDKMTELRLGPRTHTELLDPSRSTGLCVDVCIMDA